MLTQCSVVSGEYISTYRISKKHKETKPARRSNVQLNQLRLRDGRIEIDKKNILFDQIFSRSLTHAAIRELEPAAMYLRSQASWTRSHPFGECMNATRSLNLTQSGMEWNGSLILWPTTAISITYRSLNLAEPGLYHTTQILLLPSILTPR